MRRVLACARCRGHKIKCVHNNKPPCSYCQHKGIADKCVLSFPLTKKRKNMAPYAQDAGIFQAGYEQGGGDKQDQLIGIPISQAEIQQQPQQLYSQVVYDPQMVKQTGMDMYRGEGGGVPYMQGGVIVGNASLVMRGGHPSQPQAGGVFQGGSVPISVPNNISPVVEGYMPNNMGGKTEPVCGLPYWKQEIQMASGQKLRDLTAAIPVAVVKYAIEWTVASFPELRFFYMRNVEDQIPQMNPVLVGALMTHAAFYNPVSSNSRSLVDGYQWLGPESFNVKNSIYEKLVIEAIFSSGTFLLNPDIEVANALLLLSSVKWGHNDYYTSWMLHGCATRMSQALFFDEPFVRKCKNSTILNEMRLRTYWCGFLLDRIICTGEGRSFAIQDYPTIPLPKNDSDLAAEYNATGRNREIASDKISENTLTIQDFYGSLKKLPSSFLSKNEQIMFIKMYDIWGHLNEYLTSNNGVSNKALKVWDPETELGKIRTDLQNWRAVLPEEWVWSAEKYRNVNSSLRTDIEPIMMNCLYMLSMIFLTRAFLPFLPHSVDKPEGSGYGTPPTEDYWVENARTCFKVTRDLSALISVLLDEAVQKSMSSDIKFPVFATPFFSFVAFICAVQCSYGANFPWMDPDHNYYEKDSNSSQSLVYCSKKMLELLEHRVTSHPVTKTWLMMVIKTQELYRFVSNNKERAKKLNWNCSTIGHARDALLPGTLTGGKYQDLSFLKTEDENIPQYMRSNDMSHIGNHNVSQIDNPADQLLPEHLQNMPPNTIKHLNLKVNNYGQKLPPQGSNSQASELQKTSSVSAFPPPQAMYPVFAAAKTISTDGSDQKFNSLSINGVQPNVHGDVAGNTVKVTNPMSNLPNQTSTVMEPDTDKLSLLFNDQELDLLLQFSM
ncbi:HEL215Wp [Eremothecium sinecaudum]|uniref:HEL215Wp n=1 Tax=Eremothecium sinecaudum TaxID=45286 RepID=A0A0X8HTA4_9SACH|nr:HEL215Wp [Eremothecium sinecaudum]AMD21066.1 HEL215Wp [Eremothecium sinecaudum]